MSVHVPSFLVALTAALPLVWNAAHAAELPKDYPNRPIRLIVPFPPGGSNDILGPLQRIPVLAALQALTINAAQQYGELDSKGSISQGKLADLVILSEDPLRVDPEKIPEIQVLQTISHGRTVFEKKQ